MEKTIKKLHELSETYESENFIIERYTLKAKYLLKCRKLQDAQIEVDAGIAFDIQTGVELQHIYFLGFKASICILLKDIDGAKQTLSQAKAIQMIKGRVPPFFISSYLMSQFLFDLFLLEESVLSQDKSNISKYHKKAYKSGKNALSNSYKHACDRTEAMRLMGIYNWLIGNQRKASKWWNKSVAEGERLGARIELARTYMEIGKRFLKKESRFHELNGIKATEYLEKARVLFKEMNLQWDLDELNRLASSALDS